MGLGSVKSSSRWSKVPHVYASSFSLRFHPSRKTVAQTTLMTDNKTNPASSLIWSPALQNPHYRIMPKMQAGNIQNVRVVQPNIYKRIG
jgi:hypothetical protein